MIQIYQPAELVNRILNDLFDENSEPKRVKLGHVIAEHFAHSYNHAYFRLKALGVYVITDFPVGDAQICH